MTEFISRKYGNDGYEVIIKTDSHEHYKASEDFARRLIDHAKPMTNADRIRAKNDEELAEWISVKDRLPDPFISVLVQMPGEEPFPTVREGFISNDGIWQSAMYQREPGEVTHWQPMPKPPKGE